MKKKKKKKIRKRANETQRRHKSYHFHYCSLAMCFSLVKNKSTYVKICLIKSNEKTKCNARIFWKY